MKKVIDVAAGVLLLGSVAGFLSWFGGALEAPQPQAATPAVAPKQPDTQPCPNCPEPEPVPKPKPKPKPWGPRAGQSVGLVGGSVGQVTRDGPVHNGVEVQADLPVDQLIRNTGGRDGAGLCVFTSIMFGARLQNEPELKNFQQNMKQELGGGYPSKVDKMIEKYAPTVYKNKRYIQYEGRDFSIVKQALKTGRMPAVTWGDAHMVNIVRMQDGIAAFRDNNLVGPNEILWCTEQEAQQRMTGRDGRYWAVILTAPRPPAPPRRGSVQTHSRFDYEDYGPDLVSGPYNWTTLRGDDGPEWLLWQNGLQLGNWSLARDAWYERVRPGQFRRASLRPPAPLPDDAIEALQTWVGAGVEKEKLHNHERYARGDTEIDAATAMKLLGGPTGVRGGLPDDTDKNHLVVIGSEHEVSPVIQDLNRSEFKNLRENTLLQVYSPDDWAISQSRYGFDCSGHPTIYLLSPTGLVEWHEPNYRGLATLIELRSKDPSYKPENDPGMPKPNQPMVLGDAWQPAHTAMGGGLLLVMIVSVIASALLKRR